MGPISSRFRRRNMSNNRRITGNSSLNIRDSDDEETDLPVILSYLIRSGQVRIYANNAMIDDMDEDETIMGRRRCSSSPQAEPNPDTSRINGADIQQQTLLESGRWYKNRHHCIPTVPHVLHKREIGINQNRGFTKGDRTSISTLYIPNTMRRVACYKNKAFCGTYSKDGNIFLTAAQDHFIRIYDTTNDRFRHMKSIRARDVGWSILDTAFSPDGNYLIYSSWSDCIHLCNIQGERETHEALHLFPGQSSFCIFSLMFSLDNKEILGGANYGCFYVYDRGSNQKVLTVQAHDEDVNAVAFADENSNILYTGGDDGLCKVWDRRTLREKKPVGIFSGHSNGITHIDSRGDARYLISNSKDQTIKLWDMRRFSSEEGVQATKSAVTAQRWDYRWQPVPRKMARTQTLAGDSSLMTYRGHRVLHTLIRCKFSPAFSTGQRYIYTGCATGNPCIYDVLTGKIVTRLTNAHIMCVRDVSWHPTKNFIITTSWDGTIGQWRYAEPNRMYKSDEKDDSDDSENSDGEVTCRPRRSKNVKVKRSRHQTNMSAWRKLYD